jgi:hypothetical protein
MAHPVVSRRLLHVSASVTSERMTSWRNTQSKAWSKISHSAINSRNFKARKHLAAAFLLGLDDVPFSAVMTAGQEQRERDSMPIVTRCNVRSQEVPELLTESRGSEDFISAVRLICKNEGARTEKTRPFDLWQRRLSWRCGPCAPAWFSRCVAARYDRHETCIGAKPKTRRRPV